MGPNIWKPYGDALSNVSDPVFLSENPENLLRSGDYIDVPVLIGTNSDEGALNAVGYLDGRANFQDIDEHWNDFLGPLILFHRSFDETTLWDKKMARNIKELYFGSESISK